MSSPSSVLFALIEVRNSSKDIVIIENILRQETSNLFIVHSPSVEPVKTLAGVCLYTADQTLEALAKRSKNKTTQQKIQKALPGDAPIFLNPVSMENDLYALPVRASDLAYLKALDETKQAIADNEASILASIPEELLVRRRELGAKQRKLAKTRKK